MHTPSPVGVNRRTAVLFNSKKVRTTPVSNSVNTPTSTTSSPSSSMTAAASSTGKKSSGRIAKTRQQQEQQRQELDIKIPESHSTTPALDGPISPRSTKGPTSPVSRKRSSSTQSRSSHILGSDSLSNPSPVKKLAMSGVANDMPASTSSHVGGPDISTESFKAYRNKGHHIRSSSESESSDELSSGDESISEQSSDTSSNHTPSGE